MKPSPFGQVELAALAWLVLLACLGCTSEGGVGGAGSGGTAAAGASAGGTSGSSNTAGSTSTGGSSAGASAGGSAGASAGGSAGGGGAPSACNEASLIWRTANKTHYTSYPDPNSEECVEYNGCTWEGLFAACNGKKTEAWVAEHDIAAAFPGFGELALHDLCLRQGTQTMIVTVLDTCADSDCDGCCTANQGSADQLIDLESYTNQRWGLPDGPIEWADLGPTSGTGCD